MLHVVHAWASENHLMLGAVKSEGGRNEILSIPKLLKLLDLKGVIVTLDAMGTQVGVARGIAAKEGDYVMALKGNQESLHRRVKALWKDLKFEQAADSYEVVEKGHGRIERRRGVERMHVTDQAALRARHVCHHVVRRIQAGRRGLRIPRVIRQQ